MRGKHGKQQTDSASRARELVRQHIGLFPRVESHYRRRETKRQYLHSDLNQSVMYRLYEAWLKQNCEAEKHPFQKLKVSPTVYSEVFNREFNLSFYKPKKDQCGICVTYHTLSEEQKNDPKNRDEYEAHREAKEAAREEKARIKDNLEAKEVLACFDLQQVLLCPESKIGELYYKRRLNCYNLTVYDVGKKEGYCYYWREDQASRGSCEVATAVFPFLMLCGQRQVQTVYLFVDSTNSQNRNTIVPAMIAYVCWNQHSNINAVRLHFFEKNHGQSEGDSVHSVIERAKKRAGSVTHPRQYPLVMRMAKVVGKPYQVVEFDHSSILDWKGLSEVMNLRMSRDQTTADGEPGPVMNWNKVRVLEARRESVGQLFIKFGFRQQFYTLPLKKSRGRAVDLTSVNPGRLYSRAVGFTAEKKSDLISLFSTVITDSEDQEFYRRIPVLESQTVLDSIGESDSE